jgi:hypothetical protein
VVYHWGDAAADEFPRAQLRSQVDQVFRAMEAGGAAARLQEQLGGEDDEVLVVSD